MLHRVPTRQPRYILLGVACALLFFLCLTLSLFYFFYAPNGDIPLLSGCAAMVLLWPLTMLTFRIFGERIIQVEHAGVVAAFYCFGFCLKRRVWAAAQMLHFDWESVGDDLFSLRLLLMKRDGSSAFYSVLYTDSPYALAEVWRDLELHYPGSGLRSELPTGNREAGKTSRLFSAFMLLTGLIGTVGLWQPLSRPLVAAALGRVSPAEVQDILWGSTQTVGSPYHLLVLPTDATEAVRTASSFYSHAESTPQIGQRLTVLWAESFSYCYLPGEVLSFLIPIPIMGACLLLIWSGVWGFMHSTRPPR